jgi:hypothetical protein
MKILRYGIGAVLALSLLAFVGCKKAETVAAVPEINGVKVDFPKLQHTFENASGEIQQHVSEAVQGVRYQMYDRSLEALDALSNDQSITADQKKVVTDLIEAMKQVIAKSPPPSQ